MIRLLYVGSTLTLHKYESIEARVLCTVYIPKDQLPEHPPATLEVRYDLPLSSV